MLGCVVTAYVTTTACIDYFDGGNPMNPIFGQAEILKPLWDVLPLVVFGVILIPVGWVLSNRREATLQTLWRTWFILFLIGFGSVVGIAHLLNSSDRAQLAAGGAMSVLFLMAALHAAYAQGLRKGRKESSKEGLPLSDHVKELARDPARKSEAIRACQEETGTGLVEAREAVEAYIDGSKSRGAPPGPGMKVEE
jgi:ribosomal protein L7/L12